MELIWLDENLVEQGVLKNAKFNSEIGNYYDFALTVPKTQYSNLAGTYVYPRGAFEFGGRIISCDSNSQDGFVTFNGKTWLGILGEQSVLSLSYAATDPAKFLDGYIVQILAKVLLDSKYEAATDVIMTSAAVNPSFEQQPKTALDILRDLFAQAGKIPVVSPKYSTDSETKGQITIQIGAKSPQTYSSREYSAEFPVEVTKQFVPVSEIHISYYSNSGVLQAEKVRYRTSTGSWSASASDRATGFDARIVSLIVSQEEYAYPNWNAIIASVQVKDAANVSVTDKVIPDVGDNIVGYDETTGVEVTETVTSKSIDISNEFPVYSYET